MWLSLEYEAHCDCIMWVSWFIRQVGLQWLSFGWVSPPWLCAYFDFVSLINAWAMPWFYHWAGQSNLESFGWLGPIVILTLAWHPSKEFYWLMISKYEVWAGPHIEYEANLHFYVELDSSFTFLMSDTLIPPGINLVDIRTIFFRNPWISEFSGYKFNGYQNKRSLSSFLIYIRSSFSLIDPIIVHSI